MTSFGEEGDVEDGYDDFFAANSRAGEYSLYIPAEACDLGVHMGQAHVSGESHILLDIHPVNQQPGTSANIDFTLPTSWGTLRGDIIMPQGASFKYCTDFIMIEDENSAHRTILGNGITFPLGNVYGFPHLPAGTYTVTAAHRELGAGTYENVVVTEGQTTTRNIDFTTAQPATADGDIASWQERDGGLNIGDAVVELRCSIGALTPTAEDITHGDVAPLQEVTTGVYEPNPDGTISIGDAVVILRAVVGLVTWEGMAPVQ